MFSGGHSPRANRGRAGGHHHLSEAYRCCSSTSNFDAEMWRHDWSAAEIVASITAINLDGEYVMGREGCSGWRGYHWLGTGSGKWEGGAVKVGEVI